MYFQCINLKIIRANKSQMQIESQMENITVIVFGH